MCLQALKLEFSTKEIDNLIFLADSKGDGKILYTDFIKVLKAKQTQRDKKKTPNLKDLKFSELKKVF